MEEYTLEWVLTRDEKFRYQLLDRMRSFPADGKPEWLTWEQIEAYEAEMEAIPHRDQ